MTINEVTGLIGACAGLLTALGALIAAIKKKPPRRAVRRRSNGQGSGGDQAVAGATPTRVSPRTTE